MKVKLEPCPFCGNTELFQEFQPPITVVASYIGCGKCKARGGRATHNCLDINKDETLESKAIELWNRRPK